MQPQYNPFRRAFWFGQLDARPLSLFRIAFALLILKDALYHIPLARWFYSDDGVLPRVALIELGRDDRFSFMDAMPYEWMAILVFLLWAAVAVGLLVGWRTRQMSILNFILMLSIHERNVYVLSGSDSLMRALSFWMLFVPLGAYYSLDARRDRQHTPRTAYAFPVRMMQLQVALVYLFAGWLKLMGETWLNGDALGYVFQLDTMLLPPGEWFRAFAPDWLLRFLTRATIWFELAFIVLVFAPFAQPSLRLAALFGGALLHGCIGIMLSIPDFSLLMAIAYLAFVEGDWLRHIPPLRLPEMDTRPPDAPMGVWRKRALTVVLALAMLGVVWWNLDSLADYGNSVAPMPRPLRSLMWYSGLWQYWDLFAPLPLQIDGWTTIPAVFEDGTVLDLRTGQPPSDAQQRILFGAWVRFEKFEDYVFDDAPEAILLAWGRAYCREYNVYQARPEGQRLATLEIHFRYRRSHAPGAPPNEYREVTLWRHWCYDQYAY